VPWKPPVAKTAIAAMLPDIEAKRTNHTVLIGGKRGAGKTVVLLDLVQYWRERLKIAPLTDQELTDALKEAESRRDTEPHDGERRGAAVEMRSPIVPLGIVDLQTLPIGGDVLPSIGSLFRRVVEALESYHGQRNIRSLLPPLDEGGELHSREAWRRFMYASAMWERKLGARSGKLDLDAYTAELEEKESVASNLRSAFASFIDALAKEGSSLFLHGGEGAYPLFVVAIDDADLNPEKIIDLVNTIRTLEHPRVAYILTGYTDLFVYAIWFALRRQFAGQALPATSGLNLEEDASQYLLELAIDIYGKLVPAAHQLLLRSLPAGERLSKLNLRTELERITFAGRPFLYYFDLNTARGRQSADGTIDAHQSIGALPDRFRHIQNLIDYIHKYQGDNPQTAPIRIVTYLYDRLIEASSLSPNQRRILRDSLRIENKTEGRFAVTHGNFKDHLTLRPIEDPRHVRRRKIRSSLNVSTTYYRLASQSFLFNDNTSVPEETGAALVLATDMAADAPAGEIIGGSLAAGGLHAPFAITQVAGIGRSFSWPLPGWDTFLDVALFNTFWAQAIAALTPEVDLAARLFIDIAIKVARDRDCDPYTTSESIPTMAMLKKNADKAFGRNASGRDQAPRRWLTSRIVLLAAPESGLSLDAANDCFKHFFDGVNADAIRGERLKRAALRDQRNIDATYDEESELLARIDKRCSGYDFTKIMPATSQDATEHP